MAFEVNPAVARPEHWNEHQNPVGTAGFYCSSLLDWGDFPNSTESEGRASESAFTLLASEAYFGNGGR